MHPTDVVNSRTFASQAKIRIFASQMTSVYPKKCPRFKPRWLAKSTIWLITTFVFHYQFELLIQQLFKMVSSMSLLWTADSLFHAPWVHLSIDFPTHWAFVVRVRFWAQTVMTLTKKRGGCEATWGERQIWWHAPCSHETCMPVQ
jgi:hypothetical protein